MVLGDWGGSGDCGGGGGGGGDWVPWASASQAFYS